MDLGLQRRIDAKTGLPSEFISVHERQAQHKNSQLQLLLQNNRKFQMPMKQQYFRDDGTEIHVI